MNVNVLVQMLLQFHQQYFLFSQNMYELHQSVEVFL